MKLQPLGKNIIFIFLEDTNQGQFTPSHGGRILLTQANNDHNRVPKWGKVAMVGPEVDPEIKEHSYILITPLKWTPGFDFDGIKFWKTDSDQVMAVSDVPHHSY